MRLTRMSQWLPTLLTLYALPMFPSVKPTLQPMLQCKNRRGNDFSGVNTQESSWVNGCAWLLETVGEGDFIYERQATFCGLLRPFFH